MLHESELAKVLDLELEMRFGRKPQPNPSQLEAEAKEEPVAGPFFEHEDSHGHLTYHRVRQYKG